ncbi:chaperone for protein-folding within the ER, fungal-domain-containing protein [Clohesyomyces aquaticus]|uniref:Protein ROT1 n=1 Tax=Clohesyomyces aquaticus TaxID=1231657 RepID=A0A1Y1YK49_9PLEO|nr:chaperone for protein-folding within the ER, fungal-domain-containing protein [Clohesyomyces aquaticus]
MIPSIFSAVLLSAGLSAAQTLPTDLIGTWSSKSNSTLTGPGFYDPVNEKFTEPKHTGISYSFSEDGHYEEAYYRAIANPTNPKCPRGIIQWQHGSFVKNDNGSLSLTPIAVDGRQLYSDPCLYENAVYTRYNTTELFKQYEVITDPYHNIPRLNLYKFDGEPLMPLYLAFSPPQMLPTTTLNPLTTSTPGGAKATGKIKRSELPMNHNVINKRTPQELRQNQVWWFGVFLTASGGVLYFFF